MRHQIVDISGANNPFYGKRHTEETRAIIKRKRANQIFTEETKKKIGVASKLMWATNGKKIVVNEKDLIQQYTDLKLPIKDIAQHFNCSITTIARRVRLFNIKHRNADINTSKEQLVELYSNKKLSMQDIANLYHCNIDTIFNRLHEYNIPVRGSSCVWTEKAKLKVGESNRKFRITQQELEDRYCKQGLSGNQIAAQYNCTKIVILQLLRKYHIHARNWKNISVEDKNIRIQNTLNALHICPNKPERYLTSLLNMLYPDEWKYVGDGQVVINGFNPDWINVNSKKKVIEFYGEYWHGTLKKKHSNEVEEHRKIDRYAEYGYSTLIIWEKELNNINKVATKIVKFAEAM